MNSPKQTMKIKLADREVGDDFPPYVIAEISGNHGGLQSQAWALIKAAKAAGADSVKFQAYTPDTITMRSDHPSFRINNGGWSGLDLYELYSDAHTPFEWFPEMFALAKDIGITAFASVFDRSSVDMLEKLDCPFYKIASFEFCDTPLIEYVAKTGKPIILSTGMTSPDEIAETERVIQGTNVWYPHAYLHCVSGYPAKPKEYNLHKIKYLRSKYLVPVGVSDHSIPNIVPVAAVTIGASIIEKHIKLSHGDRVHDSAFSLVPEEFRSMVDAVKETYEAIQPSEALSEKSSLPFRRSLYAVKDVAAGERFSELNVRSIRPGDGLSPRLYAYVLGATASRNVKSGSPLSQDDLLKG